MLSLSLLQAVKMPISRIGTILPGLHKEEDIIGFIGATVREMELQAVLLSTLSMAIKKRTNVGLNSTVMTWQLTLRSLEQALTGYLHAGRYPQCFSGEY